MRRLRPIYQLFTVRRLQMTMVTVYSRGNCHLCEKALATLRQLQSEFIFEITEKLIDGDPNLEKEFGEQVPVTFIDGKRHDFFKVDPERFSLAMQEHRRRQ
jgi:glutaredoxin